jgi:uncharacterized protein (DUF697 family)
MSQPHSEPMHLPIPIAQACDPHEARRIVERHTLYAVLAGVVPNPLVAGMAVKSIQLKMLYQLSKHYNLAFSKGLAHSILVIIVAGLAATLLIRAFNWLLPPLNPLDIVRRIGTLAIGGGAETFAVGYIINQHFAAGGTLSDFSILKSRQQLAAAYTEGQQVARQALSGTNKA